MEKDRDGVIWIENEEVKVKDPAGLGRYPRISPGEYVDIIIDGTILESSEAVISSDNNIEIKKLETSPSREFKLRVSEDRLKAYLKVIIVPGVKVRINDTEPANMLKVSCTVEKKEFPSIEENEIIDYLNKNGIVSGIKEEVLQEIVAARQSGEYLIAEGTPPVKGKDARVVPVKVQTVDLNDSFNKIYSFSIGEVVAYKIPAVPGEPGKDVYGKQLLPPKVKELELVAGKGIRLSEDGLKAIAISSGRPKIIKRSSKRIVKIIPEYIVNGDVDKTTGSLDYEGDLIVLGNINDYFDVKVGNNLRVKGTIANSEVVVSGDVVVKENIITSKILAGRFLNSELLDRIKMVKKKTDLLLVAVDEILGVAGERSEVLKSNLQLGRIFRLLLKEKFKDYISCIQRLLADIKEINPKSELVSVLNEFLNQVTDYKKLLQNNDTALFENFRNKIQVIIQDLSNEKRADVYANYIQNSQVYSSGDVIIANKGCYNSQISAGGSIIAFGKDGYLKGGNYTASEEIIAKEVGGGLTTTYFRVGKGLYAEHVRGSIIIKSAHDTIRYTAGQSKLNIRVDDQGRIRFTGSLPQISKIRERSKYHFIPGVKEGQG